MHQGKVLPVVLLRQICASIMMNLPHATISKRFKVAKSTVQKYKSLLKKTALKSSEDVLFLSEIELVKIIYGSKAKLKYLSKKLRIILGKESALGKDVYHPDFLMLAIKYSSDPRIRKSDLFAEYVHNAVSNAKITMSQSAFNLRLNEKIKSLKGPDVYLHRKHVYGDELELDWCGDTYEAVNENGELCTMRILVLTWAASYFSYAKLVKNFSTETTVKALRDAFLSFKCLPHQLLTDNPKTLVLKHSCDKEALLQEDFNYFMQRCGILVNANRPCRANEKSAVEETVKLIQQRCLFRMEKGLNISEANTVLQELLNIYINRTSFRGDLSCTREHLFEKYEKKSAQKIKKELPFYVQHFPYIKVSQNYHIRIFGSYYSVPYILEGKYVEAEIKDGSITVLYEDKIVAEHRLVNEKEKFTTIEEHMPQNHRVFEEISSIKSVEDIILMTKELSIEIIAFCSLLLTRSSELNEMKKACLYVIRRYKSLRSDNDREIFNRAIKNLVKRLHIKELNTYSLDKEIKLIMNFN